MNFAELRLRLPPLRLPGGAHRGVSGRQVRPHNTPRGQAVHVHQHNRLRCAIICAAVVDPEVSKNDEFCIQNEAMCHENEELCTKQSRNYVLKMVNLCRHIPFGPFPRLKLLGPMVDAMIKNKFAPGIANSVAEVCQRPELAKEALEKWNAKIVRIIPPSQLLIFECVFWDVFGPFLGRFPSPFCTVVNRNLFQQFVGFWG